MPSLYQEVAFCGVCSSPHLTVEVLETVFGTFSDVLYISTNCRGLSYPALRTFYSIEIIVMTLANLVHSVEQYLVFV